MSMSDSARTSPCVSCLSWILVLRASASEYTLPPSGVGIPMCSQPCKVGINRYISTSFPILYICHTLTIQSRRSNSDFVPFQGVDPLGVVGVDAYEMAIQEAAARGQKIAGVLLCNPHNPLGPCYSRKALLGLLHLCQKHHIHLISDEIYALSVWSNSQASDTDATAPFESVLSLATPDIIDPSLVHVLWGMSKDFGANGFRVGAIISQHNAQLHQSLLQGAIYSSVSSLSDHVAVQILENDAFTDDYISENKRKLATHYSIASKWAQEHTIPYAEGVNAGFFLWVDLGSAYRARHPERAAGGNVDAGLRQVLLDNKVFIAAGIVFGAEEPGWYRIVFSAAENVLLGGLERIIAALDV